MSADTVSKRILKEFRHHLHSRGFESGYYFEPWERETKRAWKPIRGTAFITGFLEVNSDLREFVVEVHQIVEADIGDCFKISP